MNFGASVRRTAQVAVGSQCGYADAGTETPTVSTDGGARAVGGMASRILRATSMQ